MPPILYSYGILRLKSAQKIELLYNLNNLVVQNVSPIILSLVEDITGHLLKVGAFQNVITWQKPKGGGAPFTPHPCTS